MATTSSPVLSIDGIPSMLTVEESSKLLGISLRSAYRAAERGQIPTLRLGRRVFVPTRRLLAMLGMDQSDLVIDLGSETP